MNKITVYTKAFSAFILLCLAPLVAGPFSNVAANAQGNQQIVYAAGPSGAHQLYLMNSDGTVASQPLTTRGDNIEPNWSPDREQIAFTAQGGTSEIHVINVNGSDERTVTDGGGHSASWSADGRRLAFISDREGSGQLFVTNLDGSHVEKLTGDPEAQAGAPAWSPDNRTIAFVYNQGGASAIWLIDVNGKNLRRLTYDDSGENYGTAWSPDGTRLAYISTAAGNSSVVVVKADGSDLKQIASLPKQYADNVTWSEDGTQLAFTAWARREPLAIFIVAADGSSVPRPLSQNKDDAGWPSWASLQLAAGDQPSSEDCGGKVTFFQIGDTAISDVNGLRLLVDYHGNAPKTLAQAYQGDELEIIDGPECSKAIQYSQDVWYWKVRTTLRNGRVVEAWVAEGIRGNQFICPTSEPDCE